MTQFLRLSGPDLELVFERFEAGFTWCIRNLSLAPLHEIHLRVPEVQRYCTDKSEFCEPETGFTALWPQVRNLRPSAESDKVIFVTLESGRVRLGQTRDKNILYWPNGEGGIERKWRITLQVEGALQPWSPQVDVDWTAGTDRIQLSHPDTRVPTTAGLGMTASSAMIPPMASDIPRVGEKAMPSTPDSSDEDRPFRVIVIPPPEAPPETAPPRLLKHMDLPEKRYELLGGPSETNARESLCADFRLLAQEAELLTTFGSSVRTMGVDDWLDRLGDALMVSTNSTTRPAMIKHLLTASAYHLKLLRIDEERNRHQRSDHELPRSDPDRFALLARRFKKLRKRYLPTAPHGNEAFHAALRKPERAPQKPRGRRADADLNHRIASQVVPFLPDWKTQTAQLAKAMDATEPPTETPIRRGKSSFATWQQFEAEDHPGFIKAIVHRLDWVNRGKE